MLTSARGTRTPVEFADIVTLYFCLAHFVVLVDTQNNLTLRFKVTKFSTHCLTDTFCLFSLFVTHAHRLTVPRVLLLLLLFPQYNSFLREAPVKTVFSDYSKAHITELRNRADRKKQSTRTITRTRAVLHSLFLLRLHKQTTATASRPD